MRENNFTIEQSRLALRVYVLGRFEVIQGDRLIESEQWKSGKARTLFKIMLGRRHYQISRQEAAELLWPELDYDRASNNLHQAVFSLRRTLEPGLERANFSLYLKTEGSKLQLKPSMIGWIDQDEFKSLLQMGQLSGSLQAYEEASCLYTGDYLPEDLFEDWSAYRREALRQDWATLLLEMGALYQEQGQEEKYRECLHRLLASDFSHEETVQKLMRLLSEKGRKEEAVTLYRNFTKKLKNRLNLEPLEETQQLYRTLSSSSSPSARSHSTGRVNIVVDGGSRILRGEQHQVQNTEQSGLISHIQGSGSEFQISAGSPARLPVICRKFEMERWQNHLVEAQVGKGGISLLVGEPGSGKTFLADEMALKAARSGFDVIYVTCHQEQAELPFSAICEILEKAAESLSAAELEEALGFCNPDLARLLPGLAHRMPSTGPAEADTNQAALFGVAAQFLGWVSRKRRLVLVLDDLHHLPGPSVRMLRYLLTQTGLRSLLVLVTLRFVPRDQERSELSGLLDWAGDKPGAVHVLERFSKSELTQLITQHLGQQPGVSLLEIAYQISQGNTRLAYEFLIGLQNKNEINLIKGYWELTENWNGKISGSVLEYVRRVVARVSPEGQTLLGLASLVGSSFTFEVLKQVVIYRKDGAGWAIELDLAQLGKVVNELSGYGLVAERPQGIEFYFKYPLLLETLSVNLPKSQKRCWLEVIKWAQARMDGSLPKEEKISL